MTLGKFFQADLAITRAGGPRCDCGSTEYDYRTEGLTLYTECTGCSERQEIALTSEQVGEFFQKHQRNAVQN